jgi:hypothetical protein
MGLSILIKNGVKKKKSWTLKLHCASLQSTVVRPIQALHAHLGSTILANFGNMKSISKMLTTYFWLNIFIQDYILFMQRLGEPFYAIYRK